MPNESDSQEIIEAFFDALRLRQLDQCQTLLRSLEVLSRQQPTLKPWRRYLKGILAFEVRRDWAEAEQTFTKLLRTDLKPAIRGRVLYALGRSLDIQGRWEEAIATFEQIAELGQTVEKAKAWKHIAISYRRGFTRGDFGPAALHQAIAYCQLALDVLEPIADPPSDVAWLKGSVWNTLGLIYRSLGQWDEAIACYQQDLAICRTQDDRHGIGLSLVNLGEVYQKRGNWPEALQAYQQALSLIREFDNRYDETEALANLGFLYQEMGEYKLALDYYSQAIDLIEDMRAGITSEAARAGFFATIADTYANTVLLCLAAGREAQAFDYVEQARSRAFLDVLAAGSPDLPRKMEAPTITLAEVQAALPDDALLLEYFTTGLVEARDGRTSTGQTPQRHRFPPARILIFAVTHDGIQVHDADLSPNDLRPRQLDSVVERHFLEPKIRRTLYDRLIAPVEKLLRGQRRLYLVPHGPLHYIPFQALISADGETLLREEGPRLVYAPSSTVLFRYGRTESGYAKSCLVLGLKILQFLVKLLTPGYAPKPCLALGYNGQGPKRLHFAEEEARSVARQTGGQVLAGPSPKKDTLYNQAANYRMLHFSCHGEFDPEAPLGSALCIAPSEALTALDVFEHLRLRCDLVTLSACDSGLSRVRRGDELIGFIRAFMYAGAPSLVSTLWRVDERSTRILMEEFYKEVRNGVDFAEALKRAQLYLKNLTGKEVQDVLARSLADGEVIEPARPLSESRSDLLATDVAWQQASAYLKGLATKGGKDSVVAPLGEKDEERIFADPYYWAPFVLIGDHGSGALRGG
jgi:CHAT domain-containing protein/tetratricopeptide (TPR) repeat protein